MLAPALMVLGVLASLVVPPETTVAADSIDLPVVHRRPIKIRAEVSHQHGLFVQARINHSPLLWFLVDSAAGLPWILDSRRATQLGLAVDGSEPAWGTGLEPFEITYARGTTIELGGFELKDQVVATTPLDSLQRYADRPLDGILGYELFNQFVVEIEYSSGTITLHDPSAYQYSGPGRSVPVAMENNHFYAHTRLTLWGETVEGKFLVDTGAGEIAAALTRPFVDAHKLLNLPRRRIPSRLHAGLGGTTLSLTGRAEMVQIGHVLLRDVLVDLSRDSTGLLASSRFDGVIGGELLRRFKIIFDSARGRIVFEPNAHLPASLDEGLGG